MKAALPMCYICKKPVEDITEENDYASCRRIYTVKCHGEVDRCYLDDVDLCESISIAPAYAFMNKRLNNSKEE